MMGVVCFMPSQFCGSTVYGHGKWRHTFTSQVCNRCNHRAQ
jgi:hypothetical protein